MDKLKMSRYDALAEILKAIAHPTRLLIVEESVEEATVCFRTDRYYRGRYINSIKASYSYEEHWSC